MQKSLLKLNESENAKDTVSVNNKNNCDKTCTNGLPEMNFDDVKTRASNCDLKLDSSGKPVFGPANFSNPTRFQPSRAFEKPFISNDFSDLNSILAKDLGVHSLTEQTYKEQQLVEEAIRRCKYQNQNNEWYDEVDINSVKIKTHYEAVGSDADVYNDDEECNDDEVSRDRRQGNSIRWYNNADSSAVEFNDRLIPTENLYPRMMKLLLS